MMPRVAGFVMRRRAIASGHVRIKRRVRELALPVYAVAGGTGLFVIDSPLRDLFRCEASAFDRAARITGATGRDERYQNE